MSSVSLTPAQSHALLDILTHRETYTAEIELFKTPGIINSYDPDADNNNNEPPKISSKSPILQILFSTFIVPIPGLRDISQDFWSKRIQPLIDDLAKANLSESYDKGSMGIRKTLATAVSALIEYPARGVLGGMPGREIKPDPNRVYDVNHQQDLVDAWREFMRQVVYGDLLDRLFEKAAQSDDLQAHNDLVIAAHQHIVVNLASLAHYVLVTSPKGQTLLSLVERTNKLIPYRIVRQTLKVGNAATMISGMTRLVLAKVSIGTLTNWIGWSSGADEGMNLLQTIIYTVLSWEIKELESRVSKLEKSKDCPSKQHLAAILAYTKLTRLDQEDYRVISKASSTSIVHSIISLAPSSPSTEFTAEGHKLLLEYLSIQLSIRDREHLILVLCKSNPDVLTAAIRDIMQIYDPILRDIHNAVDLSGTISDFERFVNDMIKTAKIPSTEGGSGTSTPTNNENGPKKPPGVEDFVRLFERHQGSCHVFLHQFCKKGDKSKELWLEYAKYAAKQFRRPEGVTGEGAGGFTATLNKLVNELNEEDRKVVLRQMDEYEEYLQKLNQKTKRRMESIVSINDGEQPKKPLKKGPGNFLFKWQELLDSTEITPAEATGGKVRSGKDTSVRAASGVGLDGEKRGGKLVSGIGEIVNGDGAKEVVEMPDVRKTVELLLPRFKEVLASREYLEKKDENDDGDDDDDDDDDDSDSFFEANEE
ncbi:hypothetical protein TWF788_003731 [Orbilia oligospora]|uniref:PX-associated domain-containing protein n=1 Tax=Orbilia oligospora TaxID=2813651 RepID=A0A7C8P4J2_ORBOL|nr:hypothetical protein TWF788_003731 [Orbilia oligospora]KAF3206306.1 hypothetical protein TWF679_008824 [Orbilia oligospora]